MAALADEQQLGVLGDVRGLDVVELGCGTAYFSAWLARRGAQPTGVDVTPAQLESARRCQDRSGIWFPLIEADAADVPLPSFALAAWQSGHGAVQARPVPQWGARAIFGVAAKVLHYPTWICRRLPVLTSRLTSR